MLDFDFDNLLEKNENPFGESKNSFTDNRFFNLPKDKDGKGSARIRFLPDPNLQLMKQVFKINSNNQKNGIKRFISELSPQTYGGADPFHEEWKKHWNAGDKNKAKLFARSERFFVNILVEKCPGNPELEGQILLLDMSKTLKAKIQDLLVPNKDAVALGKEPKALFNPVDGYSYLLISQKGENGFINYDASQAAPEKSSAFKSKEEAIEAIKTRCYDLNIFNDPKEYKTYEELKEKLAYIKFEGEDAQEGVQDLSNIVEEIKSDSSPAKEVAKQADDLSSLLDSL